MPPLACPAATLLTSYLRQPSRPLSSTSEPSSWRGTRFTLPKDKGKVRGNREVQGDPPRESKTLGGIMVVFLPLTPACMSMHLGTSLLTDTGVMENQAALRASNHPCLPSPRWSRCTSALPRWLQSYKSSCGHPLSRTNVQKPAWVTRCAKALLPNSGIYTDHMIQARWISVQVVQYDVVLSARCPIGNPPG